jgi:hypothetical protein
LSKTPVPIEAEFTLLRHRFEGLSLRKATRYRCGLATLCHVSLPQDEQCRPAWAANLSETGIGFLQDQPLEAGTCLLLRLKHSDGTKITRDAVVVHATQQADGTWCIGCKFSEPLGRDVLDALL